MLSEKQREIILKQLEAKKNAEAKASVAKRRAAQESKEDRDIENEYSIGGILKD